MEDTLISLGFTDAEADELRYLLDTFGGNDTADAIEVMIDAAQHGADFDQLWNLLKLELDF